MYGQKPIEQEFWVTIWRECSTGNSGDVVLCPSYSCLFCDVVRNGFQAARVPGGLRLAKRSDRANDNLKRGGMISSTKVMMFVRLIRPAGRKAPEVTFQQVMTHGHDMRREHPVVSRTNSSQDSGSIDIDFRSILWSTITVDVSKRGMYMSSNPLPFFSWVAWCTLDMHALVEPYHIKLYFL